jgi:pilus assembly protein Flp/PilA
MRAVYPHPHDAFASSVPGWSLRVPWPGACNSWTERAVEVPLSFAGLSPFHEHSMSFIRPLLRRFRRDESAATMVEYGIMVALIAAISIVVITTLGTRVKSAFQTVVTALT